MSVSKVASRGDELQQTSLEKFGELLAEGKSKLDTLQSKMASVLPSFPGMSVGKFYDISVGIDAHSTILPPSPLMAVPHIGIIFDIVAGIFSAIDSNIPKMPEGVELPEESSGSSLASVGQTIVDMMKPSVKVHNQWIGNAGTSIQHLPGIFFHAAPSVTPSASSEMFMGSSKVMADGSPFSTRLHPALSCNIIGGPSPVRAGKTKAFKALMAPTAMLTNITSSGNKVIAGGPPTIDLFALAVSMGLKGLGKLWKKTGDKYQNLINKLPENTRSRKILQFTKCKVFGEPVDAATGRVFAENEDFYIPGPIPIKWIRTYYSDVEENSPLGYNWNHSYDIKFYQIDEELIALRLKDGREIILPPLMSGEGFYLKSEKVFWFRTDEGYKLKDNENLCYHFLSRATQGVFPLGKITDNYGNTITLQYNHKGLASIIDSCGRELKIFTNHNGYIEKILLQTPKEIYTLVSYSYDEQGNLIEVKEKGGTTTKRFYYTGHLLSRLTNQSGLNFYWEYQGKGEEARCVHTWGDEGILEYWIRYEKGKTLATNSLGHTTEYHYNEDKLIHTIIDGSGGVTQQIYNDFGELAVIISPMGKVKKYTYDAHNNLVGIIDENENCTRLSYTPDNQIKSYSTPNGARWEWEYDENGRIIKKTEPNGSYLSYFYREDGKLDIIEDHKKRKTQLFWDQHFITKIVFPNKNEMLWKYDDWGRIIQEIRPNHSYVGYKYDLAGNLTELIEPDGNHHYFEYNAAGDIIRAKNNNQEVFLEYWGLGLLKSRTQNGKKVQFHYDTEEQLKGIQNEAGEAYRFTRNPLGLIVGEWGFDGLQKQYLRNADGHITKILRPEERWTEYEHDGVGNIIVAEHSDGSRECFTYNPDGLLIEAANEQSTVKLIRDETGKIIQEIQNGYRVKSKYDEEGNRIHISSCLGADIKNSYDAWGLLKKIQTQEGWEASIERDIWGMETARHLNGNINFETERNLLGQITQQRIIGKNGEKSRKQYVWGVADQLKKVINATTGQVSLFEYDETGSLLSADYSGITKVYKMPDAIGNLFKSPERDDRTYAAGGKLIKDKLWFYTYDKEGNLRFKSKKQLTDLPFESKQKYSFTGVKNKFWIDDNEQSVKEEPIKKGFWIDDRLPEYDNEFDRKAEIRKYSKAELKEYDKIRRKRNISDESELQWQPGDWEYIWGGNSSLQAVKILRVS